MNPELQQMHNRVTQLPPDLAAKEQLEKQRAMATGGSFTPLIPLKVTKAETTNRQMMLQEMKAAAEARQARLALGGPSRITPQGGRPADQAAPPKDYLFGYVDWARDYSADPQNLVSVFGFRNPGSGNWRFFFQLLQLTRDVSLASSSARSATVAARPVKHGDLKCVVCKNLPAACTCPK